MIEFALFVPMQVFRQLMEFIQKGVQTFRPSNVWSFKRERTVLSPVELEVVTDTGFDGSEIVWHVQLAAPFPGLQQ